MQSFREFGLSDELLKAIDELGYKTPSPIQEQTLPILLGEPTDFIGLAATGTGKTAAFGLPLIHRIDPTKKVVQGLILCPTRELAMQVSGQINLLGKHKHIRALPIYGGASYIPQIHGLSEGTMIVVGTPGRVIDHMKRGTLKLENVKTIILDEADEMISMGFKEELETILDSVPKGQSRFWLFSATMSKEVRRVADTYLRNPKQVQVNRTEMLSTTVEQVYFLTRESDKPEVLCKLIESAEDFYGLIFCQTKVLVTNLNQYLLERGYKVDCLHGDKDQKAREHSMKNFRDRKVTILIGTDIASRGLDVKDVTHVINYSIPRELDNYVHRIGRTARSGKTGVAMSLVTPSHRYLIDRIEKMTKSKIKEGKIPTRKEIGSKRITKILPRFQEQKFHTRVKELLGKEWIEATAEMEREEIVSRFIAILASDVFEDREVKPLAFSSDDREDRPARRENSDHKSEGGRRFRNNRNSRGPRKFKDGGKSARRTRY
ncbi:MAG: ATP-dependent helicase [Bacteriovoracaceae bacterium]|nr:ATP-dependent helicase [Bacteriovoracaceae bacterium]